MKFTFGDGKVKIVMKEWLKEMFCKFPLKFKNNKVAANPATAGSFEEDKLKKLTTEGMEMFHRMVTKVPFPCKQARPDV